MAPHFFDLNIEIRVLVWIPLAAGDRKLGEPFENRLCFVKCRRFLGPDFGGAS